MTLQNILTAASLAVPLLAQPANLDVERVVALEQAEAGSQTREIVELLGAIASLSRAQAHTEPAPGVALRGKQSEVELAEWLVRQTGKPQARESEHFVGGSTSDIAFAFKLPADSTPVHLAEVATAARSAGLKRIFILPARNVIVMRGSAEEQRLARWMVEALERPAAQARPAAAFTPRSGTGEEWRIFYASVTAQDRELQELATVARATAGLQRLFVVHRPAALVVGAPAGKLALCEWLIRELDSPAQSAAVRPPSSAYRFEPPEDIVRVFYVSQSESLDRLQELARQIREETQVPRLFTYTATRAMTLRGTQAQIEQAEELIRRLTGQTRP